MDNPELYKAIFLRVGETNLRIWKEFMRKYQEIFGALRFGDNLGYKSNTLLEPKYIRRYIIPQYKPIIQLVHEYHKPFLFHLCGNIFDIIMVGINAKHSNEDQIAPFPEWVERYGNRIGNFGGIDLDVVCNSSKEVMREYIKDVIRKCKGHGGFAFGTGNAIPDYVPVEGYLNMIEIVRDIRGDYR